MRVSVRSMVPALFSLAVTGSPALAQTAPSGFPAEARIAFVNPQYVFAKSREGQTAAAELEALQKKRQADIVARTKEVEALQHKLSAGGNALNDEARERLERDVARARVDFQRLVEDSEAEVEAMQQQFQRAFSRKLFPVIGEVARTRNLWAVFSTAESNLLWHQPALDISDEIVARIDAPVAPPPVR